jgi:thiamine-phosphate pyrophosphorylase
MLITDPRWPPDHIARVVETVAEAISPSPLLVQLRDKSLSSVALGEAAAFLGGVTRRASAHLIVNARAPEVVRVAYDAGADGVHVPCKAAAIADARVCFGASAWISTPAHTDEDVVLAETAGAACVLVSPIFRTPGKGTARSVAAVSVARSLATRACVFALGGVDASNARECAEAGADGVAVIRALLDPHAPASVAEVARALVRAFAA